MPIYGSLKLFSSLDLLQNFPNQNGVLELETSMGTLEGWLCWGSLASLRINGVEQSLDLAPLHLLEWCCLHQGRFLFSPGEVIAQMGVELRPLAWILGRALTELEDGLQLPQLSDRFRACAVGRREGVLEPWEATLHTQVAPLIQQGWSLCELTSMLGLSSLGLRYGLGCLSRKGALERLSLTPHLERERAQFHAA